MKRRGTPLKFPTGREKIPKVNESSNENIYFFPFIAATGFRDRASALEANSEKLNAVVDGKAPVTLKWLNAQESVSWAKEESETVTPNTKFKRNFKIGEYFHGIVMSNHYVHKLSEKSAGFKSVQGTDLTFIESTDERTITIATETDFFENRNTSIKSDLAPHLARLFFVCPELAPGDVLFISGMNIVPDSNQNIGHMEITFSSLTDKLQKVGGALRSFVQYGGPGEGYPYPLIEAEQPENETLFWDDEAESKPHTKRIYLDSNRIEDRGINNFSVEFNGAALVSSIHLFGRPVIEPTEEERSKAYFKKDRIRPLFVTEFYGENQEAKSWYTPNEVTQLQAIHGVVINENWYDSNRQAGLEEIGLYFDPGKARASQQTLQCVYSNSKRLFTGDTYTPGTETTGDGDIWGRWQNRWNKWSTYSLNPILKTETNKVAVNGEDFKAGAKTISAVLNTNFMYQYGNSYVEAGGVKTKNIKGMIGGIINSALGLLGTLGGAAGGAIAAKATKQSLSKGAAYGTFVGGQIAKALGDVFQWFPDRWFTSQEVYRPASMITYLGPKNLLQDFANKVGDYVEPDVNAIVPKFQTADSKRIPLEFFTPEDTNYLSALVNGANYKIRLNHGITNKFRLGTTTREFDSLDLLRGNHGYGGDDAFYKDQIINTDYEANGPGFTIDAFILKAITRFPMRLVFYDEAGKAIWETVRMTEAGYYGDLLDWETVIPLSDTQDDESLFDDPNFKYQQFIPKGPQTTGDDSAEVAKQKAINSINNSQTYQLGITNPGPGTEVDYLGNYQWWVFSPAVTADDYNISADPLRWKKSAGNISTSAYNYAYKYALYPSDISQRKIYYMYPHKLYLPADLVANLKLIHGDAANTRRKRWDLLKDTYGFKSIDILRDEPAISIGYYTSGVDGARHRPAWKDSFDSKRPPYYVAGPFPEPFSNSKKYLLENIPQVADPRTNTLEIPGNEGIGGINKWSEQRQFQIGYWSIHAAGFRASWTTGWWRWHETGDYKIPPFVCWWQTDAIGTGRSGQNLSEQSMYVGWDLFKHPTKVITKFNNNFEGAGGGTNGPAWGAQWHLKYAVSSVIIRR